jgi:Tol biopolymer transport system component
MYPKALLLLALLVGLFACGDVSEGTLHGQERNLHGQISVASAEDGDWELYLVNVGDQRAFRFTENLAYDSGLVWSPDGQSYVTTTEWLEGETREVQRVMDDGSVEVVVEELTADRELMLGELEGQVRFLTDNAASDQYAAWSPDGTRIAFSSDRSNFDSEIYTMDADGGNVTRLTTSAGEDWQPSWSPDGKQIVFASVRTGDWEIYTMDADGGNVTRLTDRPGLDWTPEWSPDGTQIVYARRGAPVELKIVDGVAQGEAPVDTWDVFLMASDGDSVEQLTDDPGNDIEPTWSPDGKHIAFSSDRSGSQAVYVMDADGSRQEAIGWTGIPSDWTFFD